MGKTRHTIITTAVWSLLAFLSCSEAVAQETEWRPIAEIGEWETNVIEYAAHAPSTRILASATAFRSGATFVVLLRKDGAHAYFGTANVPERITTDESYRSASAAENRQESETNPANEFRNIWNSARNPNLLSKAELHAADTLILSAIRNIPTETNTVAVVNVIDAASSRGNRYLPAIQEVWTALPTVYQKDFYEGYLYEVLTNNNRTRAEDTPGKQDIIHAISEWAELKKESPNDLTLGIPYISDWLTKNDTLLYQRLVAEGIIKEGS